MERRRIEPATSPIMNDQTIFSDFPFKLHRTQCLDAQIAYIDTASDASADASTNTPVMLFLHDNPTSTYLWRNIIPYASGKIRCIAPDLIGMGASDKLPHLSYRFIDHALYLDEFIAAVIPRRQPVILVVQGWGSALGLHWARRNAHRVAGLVLMEFIPPLTWQQLEPDGKPHPFRMFRDPEIGRKMIIEDNFFIEKFLPGGVVRDLTEEEMDHYRAPFLEPTSREPLYCWPQEAAIGGLPADMAAIINAYHDWLVESDVPKLFFCGSPGAIIKAESAQYYRETLKNMKSVHAGPGRHWLVEDNPHLIGSETSKWLDEVVKSQ